jgi:hypothetical protein
LTNCCSHFCWKQQVLVNRLLSLAMQSMLPTTWTIFIYFHAPRVITAVLLRSVVAFFAFWTCKCNYGTNIFLWCHSLSQAQSGFRLRLAPLQKITQLS